MKFRRIPPGAVIIVLALILWSTGFTACSMASNSTDPAEARRKYPALPREIAAALHPMRIENLRARFAAQEFSGSDIVVERVLDRGSNYTRSYAYYLSEGLRIYGLLMVPDGTPPAGGWPGIVFLHGDIPFDEYRTMERYLDYMDNLARNRYVVFRIDLRGHDRSEGEPRGAYDNTDYTIDTLNAAASLRLHSSVNADRIGLWGHSMGGFLTLRVMTIDSGLRCGVVWAGLLGTYPEIRDRWGGGFPFFVSIENPLPRPRPGDEFNRTWTGQLQSFFRWQTDWLIEYGSPTRNPTFWQDVSAADHLSEISGPLQIHQGSDDRSVPPELAELTYDRLVELGKPAEYYEYEGDNHNITANFGTAMTRTIQFYERYLRG